MHEPQPADPDARELAPAFAKAMSEMSSEPSAPLTMWWSLSLPGGGGVHMQVSDTGPHGQWMITDLYVHGAEITATMLQRLPVNQLSLIMNLSAGWDPGTIADVAAMHSGQHIMLPDPGTEPTLAMLRQQAEGAPERLPVPADSGRPRLRRPDGTDPDGFSALVGAAYREYAPQSRSPAIKIAEEAGVPVGTVRSWIREARRRGKLPPGQKGKAG